MQTFEFAIRVKPGASRTAVGGGYGDPPALVVAVGAPAVDGRANEAVLRALSEAFDVRPRDVRIVSGHSGRTKRVEVAVPDTAAAEQRLSSLLAGR